MVNFKNKKQKRLPAPTSTSSEQSDSHRDINDKLSNLGIAVHGNQDQTEKEIVYTSLEFDSNDVNYNNFHMDFADMNHLKHYAHGIIDYTDTEIQINRNGAILLTPHFRQFPSELVLLIVSHCLEQQTLCALSLVSKQFYAIANPLLWHAPKIQNGTILDKLLTSVTKVQSPTGCFIRKMEFSCSQWDNIRFALLITHLRHLEELKITNDTSIEDASFRHLPRHCPNLASLELDCRRISSSVFTELGQHCHQLRQLKLTCASYITSATFEHLVTCPLQKFTLTFIPPINNQYRLEDMLRALMKFTQLTHLVINNTSTGHGGVIFQQNSDIHPPWPRLSLLHVESCETLSDNDLIPFINSHPHLTELRLRALMTITDNSLLAIGSALSCLTTLYLDNNRYISQDGILKLIRNCRQLTSLTLDHCDRIARNKMELDQEALDGIREGRRTIIID
ncbi:unnamed protein product [Absidia cylindrospora]